MYVLEFSKPTYDKIVIYNRNSIMYLRDSNHPAAIGVFVVNANFPVLHSRQKRAGRALPADYLPRLSRQSRTSRYTFRTGKRGNDVSLTPDSLTTTSYNCCTRSALTGSKP